MLSVVPRVKMTCSGRRRVDQRADFLAGRLIEVGRLIAQPVNAAVNVGVVLFVGFDDRLNDLPRVLGRGGIVEVRQRHALAVGRGMERGVENGKVAADVLHIQRLGKAGIHGYPQLLSPPGESAAPSSGE